MTKIEELRKLAEEATPCWSVADDERTPAENFALAEYVEKANPTTVLQMLDVMEQLHEVVEQMREVVERCVSHTYFPSKHAEALEAFNKFQEGK